MIGVRMIQPIPSGSSMPEERITWTLSGWRVPQALQLETQK